MTDAETKRLVDAVYGKDKEAKVLKNLKIGQANAKIQISSYANR